ncbi:RagB/SusD family nutrient uptake outer membrane protein [Flavihumibacter solisilvae]|uniref:Carbohydrate-binding protein SusD n=1 Tax=Flavihumibacter solisilvae TaxID=1349421 RepID=A0A0C1IYI2_9BACT|nr:RagB/SusD family nutrient uptake outer membrane protein [Flavihumibacter solisilvae]KIC95524.1 carbohydrate-binding protein SusD [Flavihumibacter solisilvae]
MKKYIILFLAGCSCLFSCVKEETVYSSAFTETFYKTASDAEKAIIAVYGSMADMYSGPAAVMASDFSSDQSYPRAVVGRNTLTLFTYDPFFTAARTSGRLNETPQQVWASCYSGIERANWIIAKLPEAVMDESRKNQVIGEAHFLRAFFLWTLTKNFGDVPVKTTPSTSLKEAYTAKSAKADVYKQIYSDLDKAAASGLPSFPSVDKGRPSSEVVNALYAKAALYNEDWATALQKAQLVITSGKYFLLPNVVDVYKYDKEDAARVENMWAFEVDPITPGRSHQLTGLCGPPASAGPEFATTSFGSMFAYQSFYNSFDPADKRRLLLDTTYVNKSGQLVPQKSITPITTKAVLIKKYQDPTSRAGIICNIPIFRLADMYLIAAEAEARMNGGTTIAYEYINAVRRRADLPDLEPGLGQDAFIDAVLQERSWEFFAEGDRWYDLTRTGKFLTVIPAAVNDVYPQRTPQAKHKYFPIPQEEINANPKLEQNPDWK